ncbi:MAG: sel1 repeat family protein [Bacteroidaceae bacterium]|nr:sel1 repeat family protein [Bacteroidaceae bacterium]
MTKPILLMLMLLASIVAKAQSAEALYDQGKQLYDQKQYELAIKKLLPAAQKGHKKAQYRLGRCYDKGHGTAEDNLKAFQWYSKSAAQGYHKAQYQLGRCYKKGKGVAKDKDKAFRYFSKAANQGNANAQFALGRCYFEGKGTPQDKTKAKTFFLKAISNKKDGAEILKDLRTDAAAGDEDAIAIKKLIGK